MQSFSISYSIQSDGGGTFSVFATKLLLNNLDMFESPPQQIHYQSLARRIRRDKKKHGVKLHELISDTEILPQWFPEGWLLALNDLMEERENDKRVLDLFTQHSRHKNSTVMYLSQDMFQLEPETLGEYSSISGI